MADASCCLKFPKSLVYYCKQGKTKKTSEKDQRKAWKKDGEKTSEKAWYKEEFSQSLKVVEKSVSFPFSIDSLTLQEKNCFTGLK